MTLRDAGWLRMARRCNNACRFCNDADALDGAPIDPVDQVLALRRFRDAGGARVTLSGGEPTLSPNLLVVLQAAQKLGLATSMVTNGRALAKPGRLAVLAEEGLSEVCVSLHGATAATHDALVGVSGAFAQTLRGLELACAERRVPVHVRTVLCAENVGELTALGERLDALGVHAWQLRDLTCEGRARKDGPAPATAQALLQALDALQRRCGGTGVRLEFHGLGRLQRVRLAPQRPPAVLNPLLLALLREGFVPPSASAGVLLHGEDGRPALPDHTGPEALLGLAVELEARGTPALDLPATVDPRSRWQPRTGSRPPRVVVIAGPGKDEVVQRSTLPGLARALCTLGAQVQLISPYDPQTPFETLMHTVDARWAPLPAQLERAALGDVDLVVTDGLGSAVDVHASARLGPGARIVIADCHMLDGIERWLERLGPTNGTRMADRSWPDPRLVVHSHFPGYLHLYVNYGIPIAQLHFRPYALWEQHFAPGPDPASCGVIHSGGNHLRDLDTLASALRQLPEGAIHPVELYSQQPIEVQAPNLLHAGHVNVEDFVQRLAHSRFSVVPLLHDPNKAAGVTVIVMALMVGRPVIATDIPAARDHVRHGVDGLLVPPGDARALADAIVQLDTDPELLARLSAGARNSRERLGVEAWARELLGEPTAPRAPGSLQRIWQP